MHVQTRHLEPTGNVVRWTPDTETETPDQNSAAVLVAGRNADSQLWLSILRFSDDPALRFFMPLCHYTA